MDDALALAACERALGTLISEELPDLAVQALLRGVDSPALRELAGTPKAEVRDAADLFAAALDELGVEMPTREQAAVQMVRRHAHQIVNGDVSPRLGAARIWMLDGEIEREGDLRVFIGLSSEYDDHPEAAAALDVEIVAAAREILARAELRRWVKLRAEPGRSPVTRWTANGTVDVDLRSLGLTAALTADVEDWLTDLTKLPPVAERDRPVGHDAVVAFNERGRLLVGRLQAELGPTSHVEFLPEQTRPTSWRPPVV